MGNVKMRRFARTVRAASEILVAGDVGVMPTDTIYGLVGSALRRRTVERIYRLRRRDPKKPMIVLIASPDEMRRFGVEPNVRTKKILKKVWPGKVSIILPCRSRTFAYLHRGTKTLAFRVPKPTWLRALLRETGPLVAPSANVEGEPSARTIREAKKYFGDKVQFYIDTGRLAARPSTVVSVRDRKIVVLRNGAA